MTAFARESLATDKSVLTIELRTVNHRYLDCTFKLPDALRPLEPRLREHATKVLARGKLDCQVRVQSGAEGGSSLILNSARLEQLLALTQEIATKAPQTQPLNPLEVLQFPGICHAEDNSQEEVLEHVIALFSQTIGSLASTREREGEKLADMVLDRLERVATEVASTRAQLPALMQRQQDRVRSRIAELDIEADEGRLEQELAMLAQKADVDEELDRLEAHVDEVKRTLAKGGPCGRRLDFLMQELNREANTLSSKSIATSTTQNAVELKVLIEQMREQIQNIE
jgi:uncharacterized protein (TIGR00255 family)